MTRPLTVLFVDDDLAVRAPVADLLRSEGFNVLTAGSSLAAIPILAREHIDVLFTDIVMPDQDGIELAKQARALQPHIRIVFATGYFSRGASAEKIGKLLFKPVRAQEIGAAISEALSENTQSNERD